MLIRRINHIVLLLCLLASINLQAAVLSETNVKSFRYEPLDAYIPLNSYVKSIDDIQARLVSVVASLDGKNFHNVDEYIRMRLIANENQRSIHLTSERAVSSQVIIVTMGLSQDGNEKIHEVTINIPVYKDKEKEKPEKTVAERPAKWDHKERVDLKMTEDAEKVAAGPEFEQHTVVTQEEFEQAAQAKQQDTPAQEKQQEFVAEPEVVEEIVETVSFGETEQVSNADTNKGYRQADKIRADLNYSGGAYGPVTESETLWSIARVMRRGTSVNIPQMVEAIREANPDVFVETGSDKIIPGSMIQRPASVEAFSLAGTVQLQETTVESSAEESASETNETQSDENTSYAAGSFATTDYDGGDYGPVSEADTLYGIARVMLPYSTLSLNQMVNALYDSNPDAFVDGDINHLKVGSTLKKPVEE